MTNKFFIDSNIWVYALSKQGDSRTAVAQEFLRKISAVSAPVISYQVVNETMRVLKKMGIDEVALRKFIDYLFSACEVVGFSKDAALLASALRETISISYWDSQIVASALLSGCGVLISEDLQDGALIRETLSIKNIFKD